MKMRGGYKAINNMVLSVACHSTRWRIRMIMCG